VGSSSASQPSEFPPETQSAPDSSGPLEKRLVSKNWSVRAAAFEELTVQIKGAPSPSCDVFRDQAPEFKNYLKDANPGSLEKALDCLEAFASRAEKQLVEQN